MQTKHSLLLTALTISASISGLAFVPSAQAITYVLNGTFSSPPGGSVTGTFDFDGTNYSAWNLTVSGTAIPALNQTFNSSAGSVVTNTLPDGNTLQGNGGSAPTSTLLSVALSGSDFSLNPNTSGTYLVLAFNPGVSGTGNGGTPVSLIPGLANLSAGSYVRRITTDGVGNTSSSRALLALGTATPVPLESDALPILGAVAFMGAGFWFKRRQAQGKANLNFLASPQGAEPVLEKSV